MSSLNFSSDDTKLESEVHVEALDYAPIKAKEVDSFTAKTIEREEQHGFDEMLEPENLEIFGAPPFIWEHMLEEMEVPMWSLVLSHRVAVVYQTKYALEVLQSANL